MKTILSALMLFLIVGCSSTPNNEYLNAPKATENEALVYLYRTNGHSMFNATYVIDDVKIVSLNDEEFSWLLVPEGKFNYSVSESMSKSLKLKVDFKAGKTYYIAYGIEKVNNRSRIVTRVAPEEEAMKVLPFAEYKKVARQLTSK